MAVKARTHPSPLEDPHITTQSIVTQLRDGGHQHLRALDIKRNHTVPQDFMQQTGIFASVEEVHVNGTGVGSTRFAHHEVVLSVDKSVLAEMDPSQKADFVRDLMERTAPGGYLSLAYYTTYPPKGTFEAKPMPFEHGLRSMFEEAGWTVISHQTGLHGEKMFYDGDRAAQFKTHAMEFVDVIHENLIVQRPGGDLAGTRRE